LKKQQHKEKDFMTEQQPELIPQDNHQLTPEELAKHEEYHRRLAEYLKDPAFRAIEGFPLGTDEDILALSRLPYYTACPNPFLPEIISIWHHERERTRSAQGLKEDSYQRDPFAADVAEDKNDPIYNVHGYHTKVPHSAIMHYILHYTDPNDIVFDGFCGTGMTGVAAQFCGNRSAIEKLGYVVDENGNILKDNQRISRLGSRHAIQFDLSPAATFIAYNYSSKIDSKNDITKANQLLLNVEKKFGWMFETWHPNCADPNRVRGKINYSIWSDIFCCPECNNEMAFWDMAVDTKYGKVRDDWNCPFCGIKLAKNPKKNSGAIRVVHALETVYDPILMTSIKLVKQKLISINYLIGKKGYDKVPDSEDIDLLKRIMDTSIPKGIPKNRMPTGTEARRNDDIGVTHVHQFYTRRNLITLSELWNSTDESFSKWLISGIMQRANRQHQIAISRVGSEVKKVGGKTAGHRRGTLYIPSNQIEFSPFELLRERIVVAGKANKFRNSGIEQTVTSTGSCTSTSITENFVDYIFVDPPFGANIWYSELNYLWESWLKVFTNNQKEAIINNIQKKGIHEYQELMEKCFFEFYRILKPGRWITIEFHNSKNSVWNAIQEALQRAKFVVADVRTLDKKKKTHTQVTAHGAVDQDLIISAYKPNGNLEEVFKLEAGSDKGVWDFLRYHLGKLPVVNLTNGYVIVNSERQAFLLFDRMVAFHVQRGVMVPLSAPEFYAGLEQHFTHRDGMYFLPDQVAEYDRAVLGSNKPTQLSLLVSDEKTAITWLRLQLDPSSGGEPKTQGDLTNDFNRVMNRAKHEQPLELIEILKQNFLQNGEGKWYIPDHNKASDLEKVRNRSLLKEFNEYAASTGRLRVFRTEAVRAGFTDCFKRQDFGTIITIAERLPDDVLREDPDLLMFYDSALLRK
jgi:DNA modification methylase